MNFDEQRIQRLVQGVFVRNYADTQRIDVQVIGHSVYVEGEFRIFDYHSTQKKEDRVERDLGVKRLLMHIEQQIRCMGEVSYLEMKFRNWERRGSQWVAKHFG